MSQVSRRNELEGLSDDLLIAIIKLCPTPMWRYVRNDIKQIYDRNEKEFEMKCVKNLWNKPKINMTWNATYMWWEHQQTKWAPSNVINVLNGRKVIDNVTHGFSSYKLDSSIIAGREFVSATLTKDGSYLIMSTHNSDLTKISNIKEIFVCKWNHARDKFEFKCNLKQYNKGKAMQTVVVSRDSKFVAITDTKGNSSNNTICVYELDDIDSQCVAMYYPMDRDLDITTMIFGTNTENIIFTEEDGEVSIWNFTETPPFFIYLDAELPNEDDDDEHEHEHYCFDEIMITERPTGQNTVVFHHATGGIFACLEDDIIRCAYKDESVACLKVNSWG